MKIYAVMELDDPDRIYTLHKTEELALRSAAIRCDEVGDDMYYVMALEVEE